MKLILQSKMVQQLSLTPQLQQAIKLLQLSTVELCQEIQQTIEKNPMLEMIEAQVVQDKPSKDLDQDSVKEKSMDYHLEEHTRAKYQYDDSQQVNYENIVSNPLSLKDHLIWQLELTSFSAVDKAIACAIIDAINEDGLLSCSIQSIYKTLLAYDNDLSLAECEAVRHRIQHFDPIGVGSQDLKETLLVQLSYFRGEDNDIEIAQQIIKNHLELLAQHNYRILRQKLKIKDKELKRGIELIQSLNPTPGRIIDNSRVDYIVPDIVVDKKVDKYEVYLNNNLLPKLRINKKYLSFYKCNNSSKDHNFYKENLKEARWFLKSIKSRQDTLLRVSKEIMDVQQGFLEHGSQAMKPLVLSEIADRLDLHESTISRVTTQKYIYTPRGIFELKYFFSSHVFTKTGGECSSIAIRSFIKKLIKAEDSKKPLSDRKIALIIGEQGIKVARRTIAKYRGVMGVPPSNERKSLQG